MQVLAQAMWAFVLSRRTSIGIQTVFLTCASRQCKTPVRVRMGPQRETQLRALRRICQIVARNLETGRRAPQKTDCPALFQDPSGPFLRRLVRRWLSSTKGPRRESDCRGKDATQDGVRPPCDRADGFGSAANDVRPAVDPHFLAARILLRPPLRAAIGLVPPVPHALRDVLQREGFHGT